MVVQLLLLGYMVENYRATALLNVGDGSETISLQFKIIHV